METHVSVETTAGPAAVWGAGPGGASMAGGTAHLLTLPAAPASPRGGGIEPPPP